MSDESASGSDPDLDPDVELEDAEEEEEEEEVAVEEHGGDGEEDLLGGEWPREARSRGLGVPRGLGPGGAGDAPGRAPGRAPPGGRAHGSPVSAGVGSPGPPASSARRPRPPLGERASGFFSSPPVRREVAASTGPRHDPGLSRQGPSLSLSVSGPMTEGRSATSPRTGLVGRPVRPGGPGWARRAQGSARPPDPRAGLSPAATGSGSSVPSFVRPRSLCPIFTSALARKGPFRVCVFFADSVVAARASGTPPAPAPTAGPGVPSRRAERVEIVEEGTEGAPADPCLALVVAKAASDAPGMRGALRPVPFGFSEAHFQVALGLAPA